jgi:DNA-3-methyladenine glycosylase
MTELETRADIAARRLLGSHIERTIDGNTIKARIVETESYDQTDAASHSFNGETQRNKVMFGPAGHAYVYFTYGMHYCLNIVTGQEGEGSAVLIRAVEIIQGEQHCLRSAVGVNKANGPAKLCQALGIDKAMDGHDLNEPPLKLVLNNSLDDARITQTTRIGIRKAADAPYRFYITDSAAVSKR